MSPLQQLLEEIRASGHTAVHDWRDNAWVLVVDGETVGLAFFFLGSGVMAENGNHIVYVDESGDHGLSKIDPEYPVFVLAFCIFEKARYAEQLLSELAKLKMRYFGHDSVVLHERDIRKARGPFKILIDQGVRDRFSQDLAELIASTPFTLIASAIDKRRLSSQYVTPASPYDLAMAFGLERVYRFLEGIEDKGPTNVIFECRGKKEDRDLELEFRRVCDGENAIGRELPLRMTFVEKRANCGGLQLADLLARPIGRHVIAPEQTNRAFEVLKSKFRRRWDGQVEGWGLKVFPT